MRYDERVDTNRDYENVYLPADTTAAWIGWEKQPNNGHNTAERFWVTHTNDGVEPEVLWIRQGMKMIGVS